MMLEVDTYCGMEEVNPTTKAGTEELNFLSETGTYNRDNKPCVDFKITEEFISVIDSLIKSKGK